MTRWSLRNRHEETRTASHESPPATPASPSPELPSATQPFAASPAAGPGSGPWPGICDQFGRQLLVLAEQLRTSLDELEADEADPERLKRLYHVDHAVTQMRRASRDLRVLAGRAEEEQAGFTTSLLDVIRMAASGIERYTQVTIGRVTDLAVLGYAAEDTGSLMAALLDNATRYSPGPVTVSCHLLEDGGAMFRVEDAGPGLGPDQVGALNAVLAGPVPEVDEQTGRHTGFPVVHRIARRHDIGVRLAARPQPSSGLVAMVTLPPQLLCEDPALAQRQAPGSSSADLPAGQRPTVVAERPAVTPDPPRGDPPRPPRARHPQQWERPGRPGRGQFPRPGELPRRQPPSPPGGLPVRPPGSRGAEPPPAPPAPHPPAPTAQQQAAARHAFADDLSAFSQGAAAPRPPAAEPAVDDTASREPRP